MIINVGTIYGNLIKVGKPLQELHRPRIALPDPNLGTQGAPTAPGDAQPGMPIQGWDVLPQPKEKTEKKTHIFIYLSLQSAPTPALGGTPRWFQEINDLGKI